MVSNDVSKMDIQGSWFSACHDSFWFGGGKATAEMVIRDGYIRKTYAWDRNTQGNCSTVGIEFSVESTYQLGEKVTAPENANALDSFVQKIIIIPRTDAWANGLRNAGVCGLTTQWARGVPVDVTRLSCNFAHLPLIRNHYGIVKRDIGQLFFGGSMGNADGTSPERRSVILDLNEVYAF